MRRVKRVTIIVMGVVRRKEDALKDESTGELKF